MASLLDGIISGWHFNENAEDAFGSNDGVIFGATSDTVNQKLGSGCYSFDGINDKITIADDPSLDNANTIGWTGWIYMTEVGRFNTIITRENTLSRGWFFHVTNGNVLQIGFDTDQSESYQPDEIFTGTTVLSINTFYFVAFTFNAGAVTVWLGDSPEITGTTPESTIPLDADPIKFGIRGGDILPFKGLIDESIYRGRELVQADINKLYNGGKGLEVGWATLRRRMEGY